LIYLDTSVYLRILLNDAGALKLRSGLNMVTSELFQIEVNRTLDRLRLENKISDLKLVELKMRSHDFFASIEIFELSIEIRERAAAAFPTIVATLDALHLATALAIRTENYPKLKICTQDEQMARCAAALNFTLVR